MNRKEKISQTMKNKHAKIREDQEKARKWDQMMAQIQDRSNTGSNIDATPVLHRPTPVPHQPRVETTVDREMYTNHQDNPNVPKVEQKSKITEELLRNLYF
jgi:hypothetical protein